MNCQVETTGAPSLLFSPMKQAEIGEQPWVKVAVALVQGKLGKGGKLASMEETAKKIGVSRQTLYDWIRKGHLREVESQKVAALAREAGMPQQWLLLDPPPERGE
jgi:DNA-binding transcriptional regulator YhcF (GntR family)